MSHFPRLASALVVALALSACTGGGNLSDPNTGHMHNVAIKFASADAFTADWTFQENGKPRFTENIAYHRVK